MIWNLVGYVVGALIHLVQKLLIHHEDPAQTDKFWGDKRKEHYAAFLSALVVFGVWEYGLIHTLLTGIMPANLVATIPKTPVTSAMAGYVADSLARNIYKWVDARGSKAAEGGG